MLNAEKKSPNVNSALVPAANAMDTPTHHRENYMPGSVDPLPLKYRGTLARTTVSC